MAFTSFRAGSGSYQQVRPLNINITAIPAQSKSVETYSVADANIASGGGSIADLTTDSLVYVKLATPITGLVLLESLIVATGKIQLTWYNITGSTITPAAGTQVNVLVF